MSDCCGCSCGRCSCSGGRDDHTLQCKAIFGVLWAEERLVHCTAMAVWKNIGPTDAPHLVSVSEQAQAIDVTWLESDDVFDWLGCWEPVDGTAVMALAGRRDRLGPHVVAVGRWGYATRVYGPVHTFPVVGVAGDRDPYVRALMRTFPGLE
jgi:hypothetical protein